MIYVREPKREKKRKHFSTSAISNVPLYRAYIPTFLHLEEIVLVGLRTLLGEGV